MIALVLALLLGCSDPPARTPEPEPRLEPPPSPPTPPEIPDLPPGLDDEPTPDEVVAAPHVPPASPRTLAGAAPDHGCIALSTEPVRLWPSASPPAVAAHGTSFVTAAYVASPDGPAESLVILEASPEQPPRPVRTFDLGQRSRAERTAPPAITSVDPRRALVAVVDARGAVQAAELPVADPRAGAELFEIARGADTRFAPAVAHIARHRLVAFTEGTTPMKLRLARFTSGSRPDTVLDLTPESAGGAAPTFATGGETTLYFVDAHAGISNILRVDFDGSANALAARVARAVSNLPDVPQIAVARRASDSRTFLGYVAIGRAATSAVGLLPLADADSSSPEPIVPGTAYSPLHVSAVAADAAIVIAADAPKTPGGRPPREIHVRVLDAAGLGPALVLHAPDGTASHAAIARRADGTYAVAFTSDSGVYQQYLRCDDR